MDEDGTGRLTTYPSKEKWSLIPAYDDRIIAFHSPGDGWLYYGHRRGIEEQLACAAFGITNVRNR